MIDKLIEAINEVMVDAKVDYPAGERAGPRVEYDHDRMVSALQGVLPPADFVWINKLASIRGEDFTYQGRVLCSFPKSSGKVRYIVEDRGRLFIQRESQVTWLEGPVNQTIGEALELHYERNRGDEDPLGR